MASIISCHPPTHADNSTINMNLQKISARQGIPWNMENPGSKIKLMGWNVYLFLKRVQITSRGFWCDCLVKTLMQVCCTVEGLGNESVPWIPLVLGVQTSVWHWGRVMNGSSRRRKTRISLRHLRKTNLNSLQQLMKWIFNSEKWETMIEWAHESRGGIKTIAEPLFTD